MNRLHKWALGAAFAALLGAGGLLAQSLSPLSLTGDESWVASVGGPQGNSIFLTVSELRNTTGYRNIVQTTGTVQAVTGAARYFFGAALTGSIVLTTPALPFDGEMLEVINATGSNFTQTITLTAAAGQTVNLGAVTLNTASSVEWQYILPSLTWFRVR